MTVNEPQEYTVKIFKAGDFKDDYGNTWTEAVFEEFGEPVRWVVKDPSKIQEGQVVFGHIEDATSKAGKPYNRFKTDKRDDYKPTDTSSKAWVENVDKQNSINRAVALNNAVLNNPMGEAEDVIKVAERFYSWLSEPTAEAIDDPVVDPNDKDIGLGDIDAVE